MEGAGERSRRVDTLKGIAIFFVTLGHAIIFYPVNLHEDPACQLLFEFVSSLHMELFFLVSGYCFRLRDGYGKFVGKKLLRLGVPYVVFNLLDMIPRQLLSSLVNRPRPMGESLERILLRGGELWFLYALFVLFLFFPALHRFCERCPKGDLLLLAASLPLAYFSPRLPELFLLDRVGRYLFYFTLGYVLRRREGWFRGTFLPRWTAEKGLGCLGLWFALFLLGRRAPGFPLSVLTVLSGCLFLLWLAGRERVAGVMAGPGRYSLQIYLFNGFLLVPAREVACGLLHVESPWLIIAFNEFVTFVCAYWFTKLVVTRFRITRLVTGLPG